MESNLAADPVIELFESDSLLRFKELL